MYITEYKKGTIESGDINIALFELLPEKITEEIKRLPYLSHIEEIRLRAEKYSSVVVNRENILLNVRLTGYEINEIFKRMCGGSLYAHSETIKNGYITLPSGVRVGVGGRAVYNQNEMVGVYDISLLCIRIPHKIKISGYEICSLVNGFNDGRGVLIYSPPGVGKTTLLRNISVILSSGEYKKRVVIVDTRGELSYMLDKPYMCMDILSGYSKFEGIEIATRTLDPEVIICDEIGSVDEANAICALHNSGIPLIASAHGKCVSSLLLREGISILDRAFIFGAYVGIERDGYGGFKYDILKREVN